MGLSIITPPTAWPVTLNEMKTHLRVEDAGEDALITSLIKAATAFFEKRLGASIAVKGYRLTLDALTDAIEFPVGPVTSVTAATYLDVEGLTETLAGNLYTLDLSGSPQWIVRNSDQSWPETLDGVNAVIIDFVAGYAVAPEDVRIATFLLVANWFQNRETVNVGSSVNELPFSVRDLIEPYRRAYL